MSGTSTAHLDRVPPVTGRVVRVMFFLALAGMVFLQVFVTFRGLSSPAGMETAQVARSLAMGRGFETGVVRPYAWRQQLSHEDGASPAHMPSTLQPPLPALVLAPFFRLLPRHWEYDGASRIYLLDRVTAAVSVFFLLGGLGAAWVTARRLFDERIANWTAVLVLFCQPLWDMAGGGAGSAMALFLLALTLERLTAAIAVTHEEDGAPARHAVMLGVILALLALTHTLAVWLIAGVAAAWLVWVRPRALVLPLLLPPALALGGWAWHNALVCGEPLGAGKAVLQAAVAAAPESLLWRDFDAPAPGVDAVSVLRKSVGNLVSQLQQGHAHLGGLVAAALFFPALLHPFRRAETAAGLRAVAVVWLAAVAGMTFLGLPGGAEDDRALHRFFLPFLAAGGTAFLYVLWQRLVPAQPMQGWWSRHAAAVAAAFLSALPMLHALPLEAMVGLGTEGRFAHWPPYLPDRIAKLRSFTKPEESVFSDAPWAVAWYAGRTAVWLPAKADQLPRLMAELQKHHTPAAGLLLTPVSAQGSTPGDIFRDTWSDWAPAVFRGYGIGFGVDTLGDPAFPFREFCPLAGQPYGDRFIAEMVFLSDRKRW